MGWGIMNKKTAALLFSAAYFASLSASQAADVVKNTADTRNSAFQISPYVWMTGLKGDVSPFKLAPTVEVDKSFGDVLKDIDFAGFVDFYYRQDRFVFSGDIMYVNVSDAQAVGPKRFDASIIGLPLDFDISNAKIKVNSTTFNSTLTAGYRLVDEPNVSFDLLGGVRLWRVSNEVSIAANVSLDGLPIADGTLSLKKSFGWVDPIIAARSMIAITDKISVLLNADIGGFGAGSKLTWQVLGTVNYSFNENWAASIGYKHMAVNYDRGGRVFDTKLSGPVMAVTYRF